ncbi:hypothetical protein L1887_51892 [Cichorium endivia]|nr:hypothetical protein L1887_51892 [Cichorium endivia]
MHMHKRHTQTAHPHHLGLARHLLTLLPSATPYSHPGVSGSSLSPRYLRRRLIAHPEPLLPVPLSLDARPRDARLRLSSYKRAARADPTSLSRSSYFIIPSSSSREHPLHLAPSRQHLLSASLSLTAKNPSWGPAAAITHSRSLQPSASTSWINPFGRASFSVDDDAYHAPDSLPSSRRPSAATIISTLLHGVGMNTNAASSAVRLSHDEPGYSSSDAASSSGSSRPAQLAASPAPAQHTRGPRRSSRRGRRAGVRRRARMLPPPVVAPTAFASGRRKSSALTRVLQPVASGRRGSTANLGAPRIDEHPSVIDAQRRDAGSETPA